MLGSSPNKAQAAAGAAEANHATTKAEEIANAFTNKYYPLRHDVSQDSFSTLASLYSKDSEFTMIRQEEQASLTGTDAIIEKLKSMNYGACALKVENVLAQESVFESVLIAIQGVLRHDGSPFENFSHVFLLAYENESYFIRNETLNYSQLGQPEEEVAEPAAPVAEEPVVPVVAQEPIVVAHVEAEPAKPDPIPAEPEPSVVEPEVVAAPKAEKKSTSKKKQERGQKTKAPKKKPAEPNNSSAKKEEPKKVEGPKTALNWAARIGTKPPPAKPVVEPVQSAAEPIEAKAASEGDKKVPRTNGKDSAPDGERNVRAQRKQTPPEFDTPESIEKALYVSNLPEAMQEADIEPAVRVLFQGYGNVIRVLVPNPSKHYCFVHFDSIDSKNAALAAAGENNIVLQGQELGVVARKPLRVREVSDARRGRSRGGFRGPGRGRGTGAGGQNKSGDRRRAGGRNMGKSQGDRRRAVKAP